MKGDITKVVVVGAGTMGTGVALVAARGGLTVDLIEQRVERFDAIRDELDAGAEEGGYSWAVQKIELKRGLEEVDWREVGVVVECIVEDLEQKRALFGRLEGLASGDALLCSNSSGIPISQIAAGLDNPSRAFGLHFFMPAHVVPLVEVVLGQRSDPELAERLAALVKTCGCVPVIVRKDLPGFLANRLQHALAREALSLLNDGIASAKDIDDAVRYGFGFRLLAAGPILQRDHGGLDIHAAAARSIYPSLCNDSRPSEMLEGLVAAGRTGLKSGAGFFDWDQGSALQERKRYLRTLRQGLSVLQLDDDHAET